jgi:NAD(P)-dependent dehydrogenase (short-subunit alcohol dehydrogenase family)
VTQAKGDRCYEVDFSSLKSVEDLRYLIARSGQRVGGIINLMGLIQPLNEHHRDNPFIASRPQTTSEETETDCTARNENLEDAKSLFLLLKVFEEDLKQSAQTGGGWIVNFTSMDGQFGLKKKNSFPVGQAGSIGLVKSTAREWPQIKTKCIDIDPHADPNNLMNSIRQELMTFDDLTEVGLDGKNRWKIDLLEDHRDPTAGSPITFDSESVILVTGGGYGVVSTVVKELALRYQPRIIIVGRSPSPGEEPRETRELGDPQELRQFLIKKMKEGDPSVSLTTIDQRLQRLLKAREIRNTLTFIETQGSLVEYHSLDIRNDEDFEKLIESIYERFGRIDGVIHGAGIIADKLLKDKTPELFSMVFDTKVKPGMTLAKKLRPEGLKFLSFFSSTSARFGNIGQTDYSAANEILNKLANRLDTQWEGRVVSINWGPWDSGMVSGGLRRLFSERGIRLIPETEGVKMFFDELSRSAEAKSEVVITRSLQQIKTSAYTTSAKGVR